MHRDDRSARYRILRRLGQGGMAEVFEAELAGDLGFVRKVAIKRMLEHAASDPMAARRFLDEAVIASKLHHANVISVVDLGLLDDRPFQVLEYVDGIDAQRLLQRAGGKLPLDVALVIATAVAHALDHAHSAVDASGLAHGIVHRDVKPSNVLVSWSGDVKLGDFGIAVARDREATTEAGVIAGTQGFIAPEQRTRGQLDGRTDVFALGLTLHALATGSSPFADLEVEIRALAGDPVPIDPALPPEIRALLSHTLSLSRTARPTAAELAAKLGALLAPRLAGDSRSMLRDYLATLEVKRAQRGALDALLGIEVVMTGDRREEVARYETRAAGAPHPELHIVSPGAKTEATRDHRRTTSEPVVSSEHATTDERASRDATTNERATSGSAGAREVAEQRLATTPSSSSGATAIHVESNAPVVARDAPMQPTTSTPRVDLDDPPRRRAAPIAAAVLGIGALGAVAIWQLGGTKTTPSPIVAIADSAVDAASVAIDAATVTIDTTIVVDVAAPLDTAVVRAPDARAAARDAREPAMQDAAPTVAPPDAGTAATGTGYLQVLGEDLIAASVIVDGRLLGTVPNVFAVSLGRHTLVVERKDGTRLPAQSIDVRAVHNRANPLRPKW